MLRASGVRVGIEHIAQVFNEVHVNDIRADSFIRLFLVGDLSHIILGESATNSKASFLDWI